LRLILIIACYLLLSALSPCPAAAAAAAAVTSLSKSKVFKQAFASGGASSACNRNQGSLCSPYGQTMEQKGAMLIATSPQAFDARSHGAMGSFSAVAQPKGNTI
jgi:hypothetical protein